MALRVTCPLCKHSAPIDDDVRGTNIHCSKCGGLIAIPPKKSNEANAVQEDRKVKVKTAPSKKRREEEDDDRPEPKKQKAAASGKGFPVVLVIGGLAALVILPLLVGAVALGGYFFLRSRPADRADEVMARKADQDVPDPNAGKPLPDQLPADGLKQVKQATAYLRVTMPNGQVSEGSGFFAFEPGIVITNAHVLGMLPSTAQPPRDVEVVVNSGEPNEMRMTGKVLGVERASDLAVLRVEQPNLPAPLRLEMDRELLETQRVYIFGFPFGAQLGKNITVSESSVSRLAKDATGALDQIQVNGGMHPGNSGGPVVNSFGNVVGVSVAVLRGTQINFAIPAHKVRLLMDGQLATATQGEPYLQNGIARLPVQLTCLDPLSRIRELKLEVWTGPAGPPRPHAFKQPQAVPGDGPRQTHAVAYQNGSGKVEFPLPRLAAGEVCWVQPVLTTAKGVHWGPAQPTATNLTPLERKPADLTVSFTAQKERTARMTSKFSLTLALGNKKTVVSENARAELLEVLLPETKPGRPTARIRTAYADLDVSIHVDGRPNVIPNHQPALNAVRTMPPTFIIDNTNMTASYVKVSLNPGNPLRDLVEEFNGMLHNPFEATTFQMPNRVIQPMESFASSSTMMIRSNAPNPGDRKPATIVDLKLTCTYEGLRTRDGREEAVLSVLGSMHGRKELAGKVDGNITGKIGFDLAGGFVSFARIKILADHDEPLLGGGVLQEIIQQDITLERVPGNPRNLALAPEKQPGPGPGPGPGPALGKTLLNLNGILTANDPIDPAAKGIRAHMKQYPVNLEAGKTYVIAMNSTEFDAYLRLVDPQGRNVAEDDDSGGELNARIIYRAPQSGTFRVVTTSFAAGATGRFQLIVQEAGIPKGKLPPKVGDDPPPAGDFSFKGLLARPAKSPNPTSYTKVVSSKGDYIGQGKNYDYRGDQLQIKKTARGVNVQVDGWRLDIGAPNGQFLSVGEYPNARRFAFSGASPGLDFSGKGRGSNQLSGEFAVWELEFDGDQVVRLAIDFVQRSEGKGPPLRGTIRLNSNYQ